MSETKPEKLEELTPDQVARLWEHGMHEDKIFNNRLNFFLVLESVLLGVVAMLFGQNNPSSNRDFVLRVFMFTGLAITLLWAYVSARQKYVFDSLKERLREHLPEYAGTVRARKRARWPLSNNTLLAYVVPETFIVIWIILQFAV